MLHLFARVLAWLVLTPLFLLVMPPPWLIAPSDEMLVPHPSVRLVDQPPRLDQPARTAVSLRGNLSTALPRLAPISARVITVVLGSALPTIASTTSLLTNESFAPNLIRQAAAASVVNTDLLNVRAGPRTYSVVAVVDYGAHLLLQGRNDDCTWLQARTATAIEGWVVAAYVTQAYTCDQLPLQIATAPPAAPLGEIRAASAPLPEAVVEVAHRLAPVAPSCVATAEEQYDLISIEGEPTDRPAAQHPDLHLTLRGYAPTQAELAVLEFDAADDMTAPQLPGLFADRRIPALHAAYQVYDWDWGCDCRGPLLAQRGASLVGLAVQPGERIYTPASGRSLGSGYAVLVLYASSDQLTLKYTREDNVVRGYTLHLADLCVDPALLALYQTADQAGRRQLPALRAGQAVGQAAGAELKLAIRDTGDFMDPRDGRIGRRER